MGVSDPLILRVNQLYHEFTQDSFDDSHRYRHRVEGTFWLEMGQRIVSVLREQVGPDRGLVVADLGCGTGFVTSLLGGCLGGRDRVLALDVAPAALKSTLGKWQSRGFAGGPTLGLLAADAGRLPLADNGADAVVMNASLHHLPHPGEVLREVNRVLRPGGLFALGYEPNRAHFSSGLMRGLSRGVDRASWYGSPSQNRRRIRQWLGLDTLNVPSPARQEAALMKRMNGTLMQDGLIGSPLTSGQILDLVDPHARGAGSSAGFDPVELMRECLPGYAVLDLAYSDYLGESVRRLPLMRGAIDALFRAIAPQHGSLFSWLVRKPAAEVGR